MTVVEASSGGLECSFNDHLHSHPRRKRPRSVGEGLGPPVPGNKSARLIIHAIPRKQPPLSSRGARVIRRDAAIRIPPCEIYRMNYIRDEILRLTAQDDG